MALEAPLRSSLQFAFGNHPDMSASTDPEPVRSPGRVISSPPPATDSASLRPNSANRIYSNSMHIMSPSDIVGPSPVTSNGTETTEIEDDATEEVQLASTADAAPERRRSEALLLTTNLPEHMRQSSEESLSVIHAPQSFASWKSGESAPEQNDARRNSNSPKADEASLAALNGTPPKTEQLPYRPTLATDVNPVRYSIDSATPRAQDLEAMLSDGSRLRSSSTSSLEKIDEQTENEAEDDDYASPSGFHRLQRGDEIMEMRTAFQECWNLCNTLANMSSNHRRRVFSSSGTPDAHERAWRTCWKLCQRLHYNYDDGADSLNVRTSLDLCREFCQALFDVRQRKDEAADSVLRVSFELSNHLYSAQDSRDLPRAFRERTLEFYITLCHRLVKQRGELVDEADQLLHACWSLAEMLFSVRQNDLDGRPADPELFRSAMQACWDLMEIFRHGWTQVHTDRNTPRPNQTSFPPQSDRAESRTSNRSSIHSKRERESVKSSKREEQQTRKQQAKKQPPVVPETPVTEFEDTPVSPESRSPQMPNIMVLGTSGDNGRGGRWSSNASNLSSYSHSTQSSARTSSTATTTANTEDPNLARAKMLILRAAMNLGFNRDTITDPKSGSAILQKFVQNLPSGSFGPLPAHATLLQQYKNSVLIDVIIPRHQHLPVKGKRVSAQDMAKSIQTISKSSTRYTYLRELFKFVFQFSIDEADSRRNIPIAV